MIENIKLINHSSLYLNCNENVRILSDPWYDGFAFDGGWSLLYHNEESSIEIGFSISNFSPKVLRTI